MKKINKILFSCVLLLIPSLSQAQEQLTEDENSNIFALPEIEELDNIYSPTFFEDGYYAGIQIRSNFVQGNHSHFNEAEDMYTKGKLNKLGFAFGLHGGYFHRFKEDSCWAIAPELTLELQKGIKTNVNSANIHYDEEAFDSIPELVDEGATENPFNDFRFVYKAKMPANIGASVRFGKIINEDMFLYGLLGIKFSKLKYTIMEKETETGLEKVAFSDNTWLKGLTLGAGIEKEFETGHRLRLQGTYTFYNKKQIKFKEILKNEIEGDAFITQSGSFKLRAPSIGVFYSIPI